MFGIRFTILILAAAALLAPDAAAEQSVPETVGGITWWYISADSYSVLQNVNGPRAFASAADPATLAGAITIPDELGGYPLKKIGSNAFTNCTGITSITLGKNVETIESKAFIDCTGLAGISLNENLVSIGSYAFEGCAALEKIAFPSTMSTVGDRAFSGCKNLVSATFSSATNAVACTIGSSAFSGCSALANVDFGSNVKSLGQRAFEDCRALAKIEFSSTMATIDDRAFSGCTNLVSATFSSATNAVACTIGSSALSGCPLREITFTPNISQVGDSAFSGCTNLVSVTFPSATNAVPCTIGSSAFSGCPLREITLTPNISQVGNWAFSGCTALEKIAFETSTNTVECTIGTNAFSRCTALVDAMLGANVAEIGPNAFHSCSALKSVSFAATDAVRCVIRDSAFYGCAALESIVLPAKLSSIEDSAFYQCTALKKVEIPSSTASIGHSAFFGASALKELVFAEGADSKTKLAIAPLAFAYCTSLESLSFPARITAIDAATFSGCTSLASIDMDGIKSIGASAFSQCSSLSNISVSASCTTIQANAFQKCSSLANIALPAGLTFLGAKAFDGTALWNAAAANAPVYVSGWLVGVKGSSPARVTIPAAVKGISASAFYQQQTLESIVFAAPSKLEYVNDLAFAYCTALESCPVPDGATKGLYIFAGCTSLADADGSDIASVDENGNIDYSSMTNATTLTISTSLSSITNFTFRGFGNLRTVTIPASVYTIEDGAFANCTNLQTVVFLGAGLEEIGAGAFSNCTSLASITLPYTVETIGDGAFANCTSLPKIFDIPENVSKLGARIFGGNRQMTFIRYLGDIPSEVDANLYQGTSTSLISGCLRFRSGWDSAGDGTKNTGSGDTDDSGANESPGGSETPSYPGDDNDDDVDDWEDEPFPPDSGIEMYSVEYAAPRKASALLSSAFPRTWPSGAYARKLYIWNTSTANYFNVVLNANGGTFEDDDGNESTRFVRHYWNGGRLLGELPEAELDGAEFLGWFTAQYGGEEVDEDTEVVSAMNLWAHWVAEGSDPDREPSSGDTLADDSADAFEPNAATMFTAYLADGDALGGTVSIKVAKGKTTVKNGETNFTAAVTATVVFADRSRKLIFKGIMDEYGEAELVCTGDKEREMSLTFTTNGVTGDFEEWTVDGVRERLKGSKADKVLAKTELAKWQGAWVATAANEDAGLVMSVKVSAAGKVAAKAYASSGTMASASGSLILGENCAIAPLVFKKEISGIGGFSCAVWFDASSPQLLYLPDGVEQTAFGKAGASVLFEDSAIFNINLDALADMDGILDEFSPDGVEVSRKGARLVLPKAGRVKYSRAEEDFVLSSGGEDNPAALKLTYTASTGLVKGSFKIYQAVSETRLKTWSATLWGAMIDGAASGTATVKALKLSMPFTIE